MSRLKIFPFSNRKEKNLVSVSLRCLSIVAVGLLTASCEEDLSVKESEFSRSLVPGKYILEAKEGWWNWGMAPIYDEKGKLHIFNSSIPNDGTWSSHSIINHYVADSVEGPYTFVGTPFESDEKTYHNPQISKVGDTYVLVYLTRYHERAGAMQEVEIATAKSLDGPWVESPHNPVIPASGKMYGATIVHASNPTFVVTPEGEYRIYFKSMTDKYGGRGQREISLATSSSIEGPYDNYDGNPLISYADEGVDLEDPYAFYYNGLYYMIVEDRTGVANLLEGISEEVRPGGFRPGLIYTSEDGIDWGIPEIGYKTNEIYFGDELARSERPSILWKDGEPEYLFLACHDDKPSAGYYLKIDGWDAESNEQ
ncbi:glycoside hydrolase family protein [Puniceicoccaceae bacterium K14]|nr:glycoside hydrolase family protein [Puniceicoccaceae bacterium K14]